jgi:cell division protein FtsL
MSAGYVVFLAIAAIAALIVCTGYLKLQSEITSRSRNIASLQEELADLKEDNTTRYNAVLNSVNLEEIREKAINELGMVYASPEQIIKYKSPTSNTVKQYEDIPKSGVLAGSDKVEK